MPGLGYWDSGSSIFIAACLVALAGCSMQVLVSIRSQTQAPCTGAGVLAALTTREFLTICFKNCNHLHSLDAEFPFFLS